MSRVADAVRETGTSLSTVFRNPGLRKINLALAGSMIGDWAYGTAILIWAYDIGGARAVGIWYTVRLVLMTIVTPFASTIVDRLPRKMVMISADLIRAVLCFAVAGLIWVDGPAWLVFVLATLAPLIGAPFRPAVAALMPKLVKTPDELTAANGTASTIESLAFFVGPAIAAILVSAIGIPVVVVFNALTFLWSALLVSRIRVPSEEPARAAESTEASDTEAPTRWPTRSRRASSWSPWRGSRQSGATATCDLCPGSTRPRRSSRAHRPYSASRWPCR